jgi:hypothetical protein
MIQHKKKSDSFGRVVSEMAMKKREGKEKEHGDQV